MVISGIVAEYNPFHNGHKYMLQQVREKGATHVVAVMSGAVVQRGDAAVFDKHYRAKKAVENGVDLVVELPFPYSCLGGEMFSRSAVSILAGLGDKVIDNLAFGCECDDITLLKKSADISVKLRDSALVREKLSQGMNYPTAVCQSAVEAFGQEVSDILTAPNNTLAVEYIKAAGEFMPGAEFIPIKRQFAKHDSDIACEKFASASYIRNMLYCNDKNLEEKDFCPYSIDEEPVFSLYKMEREILFRLGCYEKNELEQIFDCSPELADKILNTMDKCPPSLDEFFRLCKSRNITMARLRRVVMHLVLGAKKTDIISPPYIRILAFNKKGAEILRKCGDRLPIDTSLKALERSSKQAKRIIRLENNAVRFQAACSVGEYKPQNEYRRSVKLID